MVLGVESEAVAFGSLFDEDSLPVHQIYIVGLMLVDILLVGWKIEHRGCGSCIITQESFIIGQISPLGL